MLRILRLQVDSIQGHEKEVQMLLDRGSDVNTQSEEVDSVLQAASFEGHEKVVQILLDRVPMPMLKVENTAMNSRLHKLETTRRWYKCCLVKVPIRYQCPRLKN